MVNDILDYSRVKDGGIKLHKKNLDIKQLTDVVISYIRPLLHDKDINILNEINEKNAAVYADEDRIIQVMLNLLSNSVKFTQTGFIKIKSIAEGDFNRITVSDSGMGIDSERLDKVFDLYEQGGDEISEIYGGSGIGLAITRHLVEEHGGVIRAESEKGRGSSFSFTLIRGSSENN